jgi:hypothetical protein
MTTNTNVPVAASPATLSERQLRQIVRAFQEVGDYGEVHLIKQNGKLRFLKKVTSEDALNAAFDPRGA